MPEIAKVIFVVVISIGAIALLTHYIRRPLSKSEMAFGSRMASPIEVGCRVRTGRKIGKLVDIKGRDGFVKVASSDGQPIVHRRRLTNLQVVS